jgi:GNAT superfamily N-acetyltransferase
MTITTPDLQLPPACPAPLLTPLVLHGGARATLRPMLPRDAEPLQRFVAGLSDLARRQRFRGDMKQLSDAAAHWMTNLDYASRMAYVVTVVEDDGTESLIAEARWAADAAGYEAGFAISVGDAWQGQGLAPRLLEALERAARAAGVAWLRAEVQADNGRMLALMQRCGYNARALGREATRIDCRKRLSSRAEPNKAAGWLGARWWRLAPLRLQQWAGAPATVN